MNAPKTIMLLTLIGLLVSGWCFGPGTHAQQAATASSSEREFLDAIKKGNSARVDELLRQEPVLVKVSTKQAEMATFLRQHKATQ